MADAAGATLGRAPAEQAGPLRTLLVALVVCGVCSALITTSVVVLRPIQLENRKREAARRVRALLEGLPGLAGLVGEAPLEVRVVELSTGGYAPWIDPEALLSGEGEAGETLELPAERDPARLGSRPRYVPVYLLRSEGALHTVILPMSGRGYQSTMRGYLALAGDANTVRGLTFSEHGETPGLGAEIQSPAWRARWEGKRLRDVTGELRIRVVQEAPPPGAPGAAHEVQGISGATRTASGVSDLVRFWVGPDGFGPYLERIREGGDA